MGKEKFRLGFGRRKVRLEKNGWTFYEESQTEQENSVFGGMKSQTGQ
jgi:hypothetical protein